MKKTAKHVETPKDKTASLSELFAGTPLEGIFRQAETERPGKKASLKFAAPTPLGEAGGVFTHVFGTDGQKAKVRQREESQYQAVAKPEHDTSGFIAPLVFSYETFTLIEGMAAHLKALVCNEIGIEAGERIFSLVDQIKRIAGDGKEEIGATGLSW